MSMMPLCSCKHFCCKYDVPVFSRGKKKLFYCFLPSNEFSEHCKLIFILKQEKYCSYLSSSSLLQWWIITRTHPSICTACLLPRWTCSWQKIILSGVSQKVLQRFNFLLLLWFFFIGLMMIQCPKTLHFQKCFCPILACPSLFSFHSVRET